MAAAFDEAVRDQLVTRVAELYKAGRTPPSTESPAARVIDWS